MIQFKNITKKYKDVIIFENASFCLPNTGIVVLSGENGTGKTTLLNILTGYDNDYLGDYDGAHVNEIGYVSQDLFFLEDQSVYNNLDIYDIDHKIIDEALDNFGLNYLKNKKICNLSGGERQQIAIIRELLKENKITIFDETFSSIDEESKRMIMKHVKSLSKNKLFIIVSHDKFALSFADVVLTINNKKITTDVINENSQEQISNKPHNIKRKFVYLNVLRFLKNNIKSILLNGFFLFLVSFILLLTSLFGDLNLANVQLDILKHENDNTLIFSDTRKNNNFFHGYCYEKNGSILRFFEDVNDNSANIYYVKERHFNLYVYNDDFNQNGIIGSLPVLDNQIVIYQILAEQILHYGVETSEGYYKPNNINALLNKEIIIGDGLPVQITGILLQDLSLFDDIKNGVNTDAKLEDLFLNKVSIYKVVILVNESFFDYIQANGYTVNTTLGKNVFYFVKDNDKAYEILSEINKNSKIHIADGTFDVAGTHYSMALSRILYKPIFIGKILKKLVWVFYLLLFFVSFLFFKLLTKKDSKNIYALYRLGLSNSKLCLYYLLITIVSSFIPILLSMSFLEILVIVLNKYIQGKALFYLRPFDFCFDINIILILVLSILGCLANFMYNLKKRKGVLRNE